jgi:hypothetical protein
MHCLVWVIRKRPPRMRTAAVHYAEWNGPLKIQRARIIIGHEASVTMAIDDSKRRVIYASCRSIHFGFTIGEPVPIARRKGEGRCPEDPEKGGLASKTSFVSNTSHCPVHVDIDC